MLIKDNNLNAYEIEYVPRLGDYLVHSISFVNFFRHAIVGKNSSKLTYEEYK